MSCPAQRPMTTAEAASSSLHRQRVALWGCVCVWFTVYGRRAFVAHCECVAAVLLASDRLLQGRSTIIPAVSYNVLSAL